MAWKGRAGLGSWPRAATHVRCPPGVPRPRPTCWRSTQTTSSSHCRHLGAGEPALGPSGQTGAPGSSPAQPTGTETPRNRPGTARAPGSTGLPHGPPHVRPRHHLAAAWMEDRAAPACPKAPCSPSGTTTSTVAPAAETPPCPRCGGSGYGSGPRSSRQHPRQLSSG